MYHHLDFRISHNDFTAMVSRLIGIARLRWRSLAAPGVLALLGLGFALIPLARGEMFFYWDNAQQHYAQTVFLHGALGAGHIPHWWPQVGFGVPTVAEGQAAHYHPIRLLLAFLFAPPVAFMTEIGLYLAVAGVSTYFFLREFRLRRSACLIGGLCQMFGSFSVIFIRNMALHRSFCLLPLAMLLAERFVTRQRLSYGLAASLVLGLQLLSGYPTFAIVTIVATTVYILLRVLQRSWRLSQPLPFVVWKLGGAISQWGLAVTLGFGIAAIQVFPQVLHVVQSTRQGGLRFEYAADTLPAKVQYLAQLFLPYAYLQGDWLRATTRWGTYFNEVPSTGIYAGALPVLLALLGFYWGRRWPDPGWPLAVSFLVAMGLALGAKTPLFPALWSLPGMNGMRYPSRFLMWASFCLASLAALGLQRLLARSRLGRLHTRDLVPFLLLGGGILLLGLVFWTQEKVIGTIALIAPDFRSGIITCLALFVVAFALAWGLLILRRPDRGLLLLLVILFVFADLWVFRVRSGYAPTMSIKDALAAPEVVGFLRKDRDRFRVMSLIPDDRGLNRYEDLAEFLQPDTSTIWGIESTDVWFSLFPKRYYAVREAMVWELLNSPEAAERLAGFLGALNVKYIVAPKAVTLKNWEKVYETPRAATWKNPVFLPRVFLVGNVEPEHIDVRTEWIEKSARRLERYRWSVSNWGTRREEAQIVDHILSRPTDYRTTAVVAGKVSQLSGLDPKSELWTGPQTTDVMSFKVRTSKPALLVISNNYYPGWTVTVSGRPARLYRTNYVGMGVLVPAGKSDVVLRFITPGFRLGAFVTLAALVVVLGGLIVLARRARSAKNPSPRSLPDSQRRDLSDHA
jgi:hypothetical protein